MALFEEMGRRGVERDTITYNATISACEKGGQWERAVALFEEMGRRGVERTFVTYSSLISLCHRSGQSRLSLHFFSQALRENVIVSPELPWIDLHHFSVAVSKVAVLFWLEHLQEHSKWGFEHLHIITGIRKDHSTKHPYYHPVIKAHVIVAYIDHVELVYFRGC